jgi:protein-tyrosine-phosphatase
MLADLLARRGAPIQVATMGFLQGGVPISGEVLRASEPFGIGLEGHVSRGIDRAQLVDAQLVLTMTRRQLREVVVMEPSLWQRTFTLRELARRGAEVGPRQEGVSLLEWVETVHRDRSMTDALGDDPADDVADPRGGGEVRYDAMTQILLRSTSEIVELIWPA